MTANLLSLTRVTGSRPRHYSVQPESFYLCDDFHITHDDVSRILNKFKSIVEELRTLTGTYQATFDNGLKFFFLIESGKMFGRFASSKREFLAYLNRDVEETEFNKVLAKIQKTKKFRRELRNNKVIVNLIPRENNATEKEIPKSLSS